VKDDGDWMKRNMLYDVDGVRGRRQRMTWNRVVEKDMRYCRLNKVDAQDWVNWKRLVWESKGQLPHNRENSCKINCC